jgi:hypothetical protein
MSALRLLVLALVLALVAVCAPAEAGRGWYLMVPDSLPEPDSFLTWQTWDAYTTLRECKDERTSMLTLVRIAIKEKWTGPLWSDSSANLKRWQRAQCVDTSDPRLSK